MSKKNRLTVVPPTTETADAPVTEVVTAPTGNPFPDGSTNVVFGEVISHEERVRRQEQAAQDAAEAAAIAAALALLNGKKNGATRTSDSAKLVPPPKEATLEWLVSANPRMAGKPTADRFDAYFGKPTVEAYLAAGGTRGDLNWDVRHGYLRVIQ